MGITEAVSVIHITVYITEALVQDTFIIVQVCTDEEGPNLQSYPCASALCASLALVFQVADIYSVFCSDSGRGSSLLDRTIADRRQLNTITLPDFSDPETGENHGPEGGKVGGTEGGTRCWVGIWD